MESFIVAITLIAAAVSYLAGRRDERRHRERELDQLLEPTHVER